MINGTQSLLILGATGSIGQSTLDVARRHPDRFKVFGVSGHRNLRQLAADILIDKPSYAIVPTMAARKELLGYLNNDNATEILVGDQALIDLACSPEVDVVMAAIVGAAGLASALAAAKSGKRLLLANKESLVVAGALLMDAVEQSGAELLPIDSEHNAMFQSLPNGAVNEGVHSLVLTASGGPFLNFSCEQLTQVTPEQAVAHPNWSMGQKISIDSATLMNKGFELIEACWLFGVKPSQVEVVVHPQSVIHSMVRYLDGSVISQMGAPDMRTPIAFGLGYPDRILSGAEHLVFSDDLNLGFTQPDRARFPCLAQAEQSIQEGGTLPAVLNAANEITVDAFLNRKIRFMDIPSINATVMDQLGTEPVESLEQLMAIDTHARQTAQRYVKKVSLC